MELVDYLYQIYGYDNPIFLKDVKIGRKSKSAIREEFYRAVKSGKLERESNGIYFLRSNKEFGSGVSFPQIIESKFIYGPFDEEPLRSMFIEGYYSGLSFVNKIGISTQVPAILEITTNKTKSNKRMIAIGGFRAIIRKGRTEINAENFKLLQFLDMFRFVTEREVKANRKLLSKYIKNNNFTKSSLKKYIKYYSAKTINKITEGKLIDAFA